MPLVFAVSVFGPGFWLVRRAGWRPIETATAALALSILLVGLVSFALGVLSLGVACRVLLLAACAAATLASVPAIVSLVRGNREARGTLVWFTVLSLWAVALQAVVRNYSGGNIVYDWLDHYERSKFFLGAMPTDTLFSGALLPARPPLMNAFAAQILSLTRPRFPWYQLTAALLGLLAYFPMLHVSRLFSEAAGSRAAGVHRTLAIVLMFQPMFIQNVSYSWTRMTAVFFVMTMVGFYVAGWREGEPRKMLFAFVCGAAAILTHYSAAPYVLFLALHYVFFVLPRRARPARELAAIALAAGVVLAPWFVWATAVYGGRTVSTAGFLSSGRPLPTLGANLLKAALNLRDTFVPHLFRDVPGAWDLGGLSWGRVRDDAFLLYQGNLPLALGSLGAALLAIEAVRASRKARARRREGEAAGARSEGGTGADSVWFWAAFAAFVILTGIGVHGARDPLGLAHTAQQPLVMIGVAFLASRWGVWPPWMRRLAAAGLMVDACLGILLHFWIQSYPLDLPTSWRGPLGLSHDDLTRMMAAWNWGVKLRGGHRFVADVLGERVFIPAALAAVLFAVGATTLLRLAFRRGATP